MSTLRVKIAPVFRPLLGRKRYKGAKGGRGSGKSHFFAEQIVLRSLVEKTDTVCLREIQQSLDESVKKLIEEKISQLGLEDFFTIQHNRILTPHGGKIIFMGMKDQNAHSIKSLEGYDVAWFEEAQAMSMRSLELLRPTIRKSGSELWFSWNPENEGDAIEEFFRDPDAIENAAVVIANWRDNPWFPEELEKERQLDLKMFPKRYRHVWEGEYGQDGDPFFLVEKLLVDDQPVIVDWRGDQVFAVIDTASKDGAQHDGTAVTYYLRSKYNGYPLVILDWDVVQIEASLLITWIPGIQDNLQRLTQELKPRQGNMGIWIEDKDSGIALNQAAPRQGIPAYPIPSNLTSMGKEGRAIAASPYVFNENVKFSEYAFNKTKTYRQATQNHLLTQITGFQMGQKRADHKKDLLDTFTYGVLIALGDSSGI